jgi:hypothetical protein
MFASLSDLMFLINHSSCFGFNLSGKHPDPLMCLRCLNDDRKVAFTACGRSIAVLLSYCCRGAGGGHDHGGTNVQIISGCQISKKEAAGEINDKLESLKAEI